MPKPKPKHSPVRKPDPTVPTTTPGIDDAAIWGCSDLQKDVFYASLSFFDKNRPTQLTEYVIPKDDAPVRSSENNNTTKLLDQIALLFARYKNSKLPPNTATDGLYPSSTGQNVTAAALQMPQDQPWTLHLTKNDGPLEYDGWKDRDLVKKLQEWYNALEPEKLSHLPQKDKIWNVLQEFWLRRTSYYLEELEKIRISLIIDLEDTNGGLFELLRDVHAYLHLHGTRAKDHPSLCKSCQERAEDIRVDMEHALKLLKEFAYKGGSKTAVNEYAHYLWFKDDLPWKRKYAKVKSSNPCFLSVDLSAMTTKRNSSDLMRRKEGAKRVNRFRDAVKYLSLTRTPKSVLDRLLRFKKEHPHVRLNFNFFDAQNVQPIRAQGVIDALDNTWRFAEVQSGSKFRTHLKAARTALQREDEPKAFRGLSGEVRRRKPAGIHRYFHCELQMLDKFLDLTDVYEYFGCSKLSCYLCWCVLVGSNTKYRTNYTHRKIGINSAFPFTYSEDRKEKFQSLASALKDIENHLKSYITEKAVLEDSEYNLTANSGASDTYLDYTTSRPANGEQDDDLRHCHRARRQNPDRSDDDQGEENRRRWQKFWSFEFFDPKSDFFSGLEQRVYSAVEIPQSGEPKLIEFTAYNMPDNPPWLPRGLDMPFNPVAWAPGARRERWYPDYQFQVLNRGKPGVWIRRPLSEHYLVEFFNVGGRYCEDSLLKQVSNGWLLREAGGLSIYRPSFEIYIIKGEELAPVENILPGQWRKLSSPDLQVAVDLLRKHVQQSRLRIDTNAEGTAL